VWQQLFQALWKSFDAEFAAILRNLREHMSLIEAQANVAQFSEIIATRALVELEFERQREDEVRRRRIIVHQWLAAANCGADQETYVKVRQGYTATGQWLLQKNRFRPWFDPNLCSAHLLWMSGIPGAGKHIPTRTMSITNLAIGKTILASLVIEEAKKLQDVHVAYFYCRYQDSDRSTFLGVARGILSQLLFADDALLSYLYERVSTSGQVSLSMETTAKEMLATSLKTFPKLYVVIDGIDECERDERREIVSFFEKTWESLPQNDQDSLRCMFISQDDSIARKDFANMSSLRVTESDTQQDIAAYVRERSAEVRSNLDLTTDQQDWIQDRIAKSVDGKA
jgi:antirestriction protein